MPIDLIPAKLKEAAKRRNNAKTFKEYEEWSAIYTALKTQWNKRTKNKIISEVWS